MATEPLQSFPYPAGTDLVSAGDDAIRSLAEAVRLRCNLMFVSSAARTSAFSAASITLGASHDGLLAYLQDTNRYENWDGASWDGVVARALAGAMSSSVVATAEATASTSYVDLTTSGPAVTKTTGTSALVIITAFVFNGTAGALNYMAYGISGATTLAASDERAAILQSQIVNGQGRQSIVHLQTGLTAGSNTFTAKYKVNAGTGTYSNRSLIVVSF